MSEGCPSGARSVYAGTTVSGAAGAFDVTIPIPPGAHVMTLGASRACTGVTVLWNSGELVTGAGLAPSLSIPVHVTGSGNLRIVGTTANVVALSFNAYTVELHHAV